MHIVFWDKSAGITVKEFVHCWQPWHKTGVAFAVLSYNWCITVFTPKYGCYKNQHTIVTTHGLENSLVRGWPGTDATCSTFLEPALFT